VLVLYGDVPLIGRAQLAELVGLAGPRRLSLLTMRVEDPAGYGRIVRSAKGLVQRIVEQRDATRAQLAIHECNTGVLACPAQRLRGWLGRVKPDNSAGEYYLTDVIALAVGQKITVRPLIAPQVDEVLGVNDKAQLAHLEALWRARCARALLLEGVTLADPARLDVRGELAHGTDVFIDVNVVLEGKVKLGDRVRVGAGCVIRDSEIGADTQVFPHCVIDGALIGPGCNIGPFARVRPSATLGSEVHIGNFVEGEELAPRCGLESEPLGLRGRCAGGRARQHRRRHHRGQLRRRQQAHHAHRRRRAHRFEQRAGRAHHGRRGRHHCRRLHRDPRGAGGQAHGSAGAPGDHRGLAPAREEQKIACRADSLNSAPVTLRRRTRP